MSDYEVRLHRPDGALSIVMKVKAVGETDAERQALTMLCGEITNARIWCDGNLIASLYAPDLPGAMHRAAAYRTIMPFWMRLLATDRE